MAQAAQSLEDETATAARSGSIEDLALIEDAVDSSLVSLLETYAPPHRFDQLPADGLPGRFSIALNQPLAQFDTFGAKAFAATCQFDASKSVYALVFDPRIPYRKQTIEKIKGLEHPGLLTVYDAATVRLSQWGEARLVAFLDRPQGTRLSEILKDGRRFQDNAILDAFLTPVIEGLMAMHELGLRHGRLNPDNIYVGDKAVLGECISEPHGLSQDYLYEPIERCMADPYGKGMATPKSDAYAVGVLAYELMHGLERFRAMEKSDYIKGLLTYGSYHLFTTNKEISDSFTDFFRGLFNENKTERWGMEQLRSWLGGKRFNLIQPSLPKEASRPFTFMDENYVSLRSLAYAIHHNWPQAAKELRSSKLDRWLQMSAHKPQLAERVERILRTTGGADSKNPKLNNEFTARMIIALDTNGTIRMDKIALNVDGIGTSLAYYLRNHMQSELNQLVDVVAFDLPSFWADMNEGPKTEETSDVLWKLQHLRLQMQSQVIGYGMERAMYTLNPSLPCLSDLLLTHHTTTMEEVLLTLDALAKEKAQNTSLLDRHLAAFLASKLELNKEIKFHNLSKIPKLRDHPELQVMRMLSMAQDRIERRKLVGLNCWVAMRLQKLSEHIHNRKARQQLMDVLRQAASTGYISQVLAALVENNLAKDDLDGFSRAAAMFARNKKRLDVLGNPKTVASMSRDLGGRIAVFTAYVILGITVYVLVEQYYL